MNTASIFDIFKKGVSSIYFIGIGGISMSSLALNAKKSGLRVGGSDRTESELTKMLADNGIKINIGHKAENSDGYDIIIYNAAIKPDNPELERAELSGIPIFRRADYLGYVMCAYTNRLGIAGTHGKSTTTALVSHLFLSAGLDPTIECGAVIPEIGGACHDGNTENFIFEACEYTDSFLSFFPTTAIVTNIGIDHLDYFSGLANIISSFKKYIGKADTAICNFDDSNVRTAAEGYRGVLITYGIKTENADYTAKNIRYENGFAHFDIYERGKYLCAVKLGVPGDHNIMNALAAAAAARLAGISDETISRAAESFTGCHRRFEKICTLPCGAPVYDDYAHHPSEITTTISGIRKLGYTRIIIAFQPHTYSRTASLYDEFITALRKADILILADIYAAREINTYGVSSEALANITGGKYFTSFDEIVQFIRDIARSGDIVVTMGAGDIYKVAEKLSH